MGVDAIRANHFMQKCQQEVASKFSHDGGREKVPSRADDSMPPCSSPLHLIQDDVADVALSSSLL